MATKMFGGKESKSEERSEARAVRSGKVSPAEYARREKAEGDSKSMGALKARGSALASGRMSADRYASMDHPKKMANGGLVTGGGSGMSAPNAPTGVCGPGVRSHQDYKK